MATTFPIYYSFATATPPPCDFFCQASKAIGGEANAIQGVGNDIQMRLGKGTDKTKQDLKNASDAIGGQSNAVQHTAGDIGKKIVDTVGGQSNAIQHTAGDIGKNFTGGIDALGKDFASLGKALPIVLLAVGGVAILGLVLVLKR
jgi:hypothetical protein